MAARVHVESGVCGMETDILATADHDYGPVRLAVTSNCPHVCKLADELGEIDSIREISYRGDTQQTLRAASRTLPHTACVVPAGIVKAIEVAAGLALPKDAALRVTKE